MKSPLPRHRAHARVNAGATPEAACTRAAGRAAVAEGLEPRTLLAFGPAGLEFPVNTDTAGDQTNPAAASDADGDLVVVWQSRSASGGYGIRGRRYDAAGNPRGGEFPVSTFVADDQANPAVAADADGDFVATWQSEGQDGSAYGIYAQRFDAAGNQRGVEFRVNTHTAGTQFLPAVATDVDGDFVIAWAGFGPEAGLNIYARRYDAAGSPRGDPFLVNSAVPSSRLFPAVAMDADGDFVVAWQSDGQDTYGDSLYARRYNAAGEAQGGEFLVSQATNAAQAHAAVAMDADGDFVVAWDSFPQDAPGGHGVYGRRYNAAGAAQGNEFLVNQTTAGPQRGPAVAMEPDGDFVIAWDGNGPADNGGVFARRYSASGQPRTAAFLVNNTVTNSQFAPAVASDAEGDLAVAWASFGQDGAEGGVFARRYDETVDDAPPIVTDVFLRFRRVEPGGSYAGPLRRITVAFSEVVSTAGGAGGANSVTNPANWVLTRDGADVTSNIASIAFALNAVTNRHEATLNLAAPFPDGDFEIRATANLRDPAGNGLDGNLDGAAGGAFALSFRVTPPAPNTPGGVLVNDPTADVPVPDTDVGDTQNNAAVLALGDGSVLVAFHDDGPFVEGSRNSIGYSRSTDQGASFEDLGRVPPSALGRDSLPVLARHDATGRVYLSTKAFDLDESRVQVVRSEDGGLTFQAPVDGLPVAGGPDFFKPWIAVDNFPGSGNGNVYVADSVRFNFDPLQTRGARSIDGGLTFTPLNGGNGVGFAEAGVNLVVGADHSVYLFALNGGFGSDPVMSIRMYRSTDFGASFAPPVTVATLSGTQLDGDERLGFRTNSYPQVVVNPANGHLYCVFSDYTVGGDRDVFVATSIDHGATWSQRQRVNDDTTATDQFFPTIAMRPDGGAVFVGWYDRRIDLDNRAIAAYGAVGSVTGSGISFGDNFRISQPFPLLDSFFGPVIYDIAAADGDFFYYAWGDNRDDSLARPGKQANVRLARIPQGGAALLPALTSHSPTGSVYLGETTHMDFRFDGPMNPASFSLAGDVAGFTGPGNVDLRGTLTGFTWLDSSTLRVSFTPLGDNGTYTMVIGPDVRRSADNAPLDQDHDGTAGEATDDRYTASFEFTASVGPDGFGYRASAAAPPLAADLVFPSTGVVALINSADDFADDIPLGTNTFNFYGTIYTGSNQLFASTNGLITFGFGVDERNDTDLTGDFPPAIAVLWDDWRTDRGTVPTDSAVIYRLDAANNQLIVEWNDVPRFLTNSTSSGPVTFRAILQLNTGTTPGTIRLEYPDVIADAFPDNGQSATVGVRDGGTQGARRLLVSRDMVSAAIGNGRAILITTNPPPRVTAGEFAFRSGTPHRLRFTFTQNVAASLSAADLSVVRLGTGGGPVAFPAPAYDAASNTATFTFGGGGVLPNGNYRATLAAAGVTNAAGAAMPADFVLEFFVLTGDINRDRSVNGSDFAILAGNFGRTGMTFAQGDLNGDGSVNGSDFALLAGNFGRTVPAPPAVVAARTAPSAEARRVVAPSPAVPTAKARKLSRRQRQDEPLP